MIDCVGEEEFHSLVYGSLIVVRAWDLIVLSNCSRWAIVFVQLDPASKPPHEPVILTQHISLYLVNKRVWTVFDVFAVRIRAVAADTPLSCEIEGKQWWTE